MDKLRQAAKELLESKSVDMVIGYEMGNLGQTRAVFITEPSEVDKLIYDTNCTHNLAAYLNKHEIKHVGKIAVTAPVATMKSIIILATEHQFTDEKVKVLGISPAGEYVKLDNFEEVVKYIIENPVDYKPEEKAMLEKLEAMSREERWAFWQNEFSKCIKCYACRSGCTLCYCHRCIVDNNQPQWIPVAATQEGNFDWHLIRAMHLAGRCSSCGECAAACPKSIPLTLLNIKLTEDIIKNFNYRAGQSLTEGYALSNYKLEDKETFIK